MRTISRVHTPQERTAMRLEGERRARLSMIRLMAVTSVLRTLLTQIIPLSGSAGWWLLPVCLLPGLAVYGLMRWCMRRLHVHTLDDAARAALGTAGQRLLRLIITAALLVEGIASMTALITLFTEGVGTQGTQLTLAVLTSGVLLFCLSREGLPRGVYLLRWVMLAAGVVLAVSSLMHARLDHFFPLLGDGTASVLTALRTGVGLGWPLLLLLQVGPASEKRSGRSLVPTVLLVLAVALTLCLSRPHELLTSRHDLSGSLLLLTSGLPSAVVTLGQCLLMLTLFLSIGTAVLLISEAISAPAAHPRPWLPYAVAALLTLTQCINIRLLWQGLLRCQPWLILPFGVLALVVWSKTMFRRSQR